ncbi:metallophosphatase domain-containing protein [Microscilla marina]|uniref:239AB n=1 Tax=Microscilla marina ATCC 23134 TaxID=313606 RepID=A1ZEC9_MICM2|nr:metallophosphatase domain-containing protein [Microscilla marina]EAY31437.1 239AB [Microscilla marina ATCC 23134]
MKIVCISDTHGKHSQIAVPEGDLLIHAGDLSARGRPKEIRRFNNWLATLPHRHKVVIAGNHDFLFEDEPHQAEALLTNAIYLNDSGVTIEGVNIWGSPITPWFFDWAFNRARGADIRKHWDLIPENIDILVTHGPPKGVLDQTAKGEEVGCEELTEVIQDIRPRYHIFGHIHEARGRVEVNGTHYINASMLNLQYEAVHQAVVIDYMR